MPSWPGLRSHTSPLTLATFHGSHRASPGSVREGTMHQGGVGHGGHPEAGWLSQAPHQGLEARPLPLLSPEHHWANCPHIPPALP